MQVIDNNIQDSELINIYRPISVQTNEQKTESMNFLFEEFNFEKSKDSIFLIYENSQEKRNIAINKILNNCDNKVSYLKEDFNNDSLNQILTNQTLNKERHFIVFENCFDNFDSYDNQKKISIFELFLRYEELKITIIMQLNYFIKSQCPDWIKEKINSVFICMNPTLSIFEIHDIISFMTLGFMINGDLIPISKQNKKKRLDAICELKKYEQIAIVMNNIRDEEKEEKKENKENKENEEIIKYLSLNN
jgi:hypothetical protein